MRIIERRRARPFAVAALLALGIPLAPVAISAPGAEVDRSQSANYLRSRDAGGEFAPQSLDNVGRGVAQVTQVGSEDGVVHALFGTENGNEDFEFPFELYHRRSTNGGRDFDDGRRLDDDEGVSGEPSMATSDESVHVAFEENRTEFALDRDPDEDNAVADDDIENGGDEDGFEGVEFPEEVYYARSTDEGGTFEEAVNLSETAFAQETDNDTAAAGSRVAVVYESNQVDPDDFQDPPVIPDEQQTTARDVVIRISDDGGASFADPVNLTFGGTTDGPFDGDDTGTQGQDQPKVGLSGDGDDDVALVVFRVRSENDTPARVGYVRLTDGGTTAGDIQLLPADVDVADLPALYMDGDDAHVLACDVTNRLLYWHSDDAGLEFDGPQVVHRGSERCSKPAIDGNDDDLQVAFLQEVAGETDVFHTDSRNGGDRWSRARNLTANHGPAEFPSIAVDTDDEEDVHVVWQDVSDMLFSVKDGTDLIEADGDDRSFANEDVIRQHGATYEMVLDGSDVGLRNLRIDAMAALEPADDGEPERFLLSFTESGRIPGIDGRVDDSDVVLFTPTSLGDDTDGTFELAFDGSAVGLTRSGEDIDAVEVLGEDLYFSTYGDFRLGGDLDEVAGKNEDVFVCRGATVSSCDSASVVFDGSKRSLADGGEDVDAFAFDPQDGNDPGSRGFFSTTGGFRTASAQGRDEDLFSCRFPEEETDENDEVIPGTFNGDITDCGGKAAPFATTFVGRVNGLDEDITSVDVQFSG